MTAPTTIPDDTMEAVIGKPTKSVVMILARGGIWRRSPQGGWERYPPDADELAEVAASAVAHEEAAG